MSEKALDFFGMILMQRIRDESIEEWDKIVDGKMKSTTAKRIHSMIKSFDEEQLGVLHQLIPEIVDITLYYLLWTLEKEMSIHITVEIDGDITPSIREVSDGLAGELFTEDGWIAQFSSYPSLME